MVCFHITGAQLFDRRMNPGTWSSAVESLVGMKVPLGSILLIVLVDTPLIFTVMPENSLKRIK